MVSSRLLLITQIKSQNKLITEQWDVLTFCSYKPLKLLHHFITQPFQTTDESFEVSQEIKMAIFVLESADCHANSIFFPLLHVRVTIQGPKFLVGTKCHYLSMQESQHDIPWPQWQRQTYANVGECHSHYDPVMESLTPPTGPEHVSRERKLKRWDNRRRRPDNDWILGENRCNNRVIFSFSPMTPSVYVSISLASTGLFASFILFFSFLAFLLCLIKEGQVWGVGDSLK